MARRPRKAGVDPFADLEKKVAILEREMAVQRIALEKLKDMGPARIAREASESRIRRSA